MAITSLTVLSGLSLPTNEDEVERRHRSDTVAKSSDQSYGIDWNIEGLAAFWPLTQKQGVAVGRSPRHRRGGGHAASARHVLDHHRLAQRVRHFLRDGARGDVAEAAGTEPDHDLDRASRVVLGVGRSEQRNAG